MEFLVNLIIDIGSPSSVQDINPPVKGPGGWDTILAFTSNQTTVMFTAFIQQYLVPRWWGSETR